MNLTIKRLLCTGMMAWAFAATVHGQQQIIYRRGPLGLWERVAVSNPVGADGGQCYVAPDGRRICGGGMSAGAVTAPTVPPASAATPGGGMTPPGQGGSQARRPSPVVVRIASSRGGLTQYGTGTVIDIKGQVALVATCVHVLRAGYQVRVIWPEGTQVPGEVLATDAQHDAALIVCSAAGRLKLRMADPPQPGTAVYFEGYGPGQYAAGAGRMVRVDGDFLIVEGQPREGDSGGPIYLANGPMIGLIIEASRAPGEPWQITGPTSTWIASFVEKHWPPVLGIGLAGSDATNDTPGYSHLFPEPGPVGSQVQAGPDTPVPTYVPIDDQLLPIVHKLTELEEAVTKLSQQKSVPGPPGPPGKDGRDGKDGKPADVTRLDAMQEQIDQLKAKCGPWYLRGVGSDGKERLIAIEPGDKVRLRSPLNLDKTSQ